MVELAVDLKMAVASAMVVTTTTMTTIQTTATEISAGVVWTVGIVIEIVLVVIGCYQHVNDVGAAKDVPLGVGAL